MPCTSVASDENEKGGAHPIGGGVRKCARTGQSKPTEGQMTDVQKQTKTNTNAITSRMA